MNTQLKSVETEIRATYSKIWSDWFAGLSVTPARLEIAIDPEGAPGYSASENVLYLPLCDGDVLDYEDSMVCAEHADEDRWRIWKQTLVHEMLHEYAHKALVSATPAGKRIRASHKYIFHPAKKHDDLFYTAIAEKASYFSMTPEAFRDTL